MLKHLKFFLVFILVFSIIFTISSICFATSDEENSDEDTESDPVATSLEDSENITAPTDYMSSTGINNIERVTSLPEANLGLNNILNIILIAIGILLILFAIAILIRLKK